ncbi:hypothetical protein EIP91_001069 [Steccherinum ochraceum]|uniref:Transmembrane protein n=1 Tax=Steccherinum ochraceum TaxID=92696 RepID=A0A4R0RER2_9APHY|nr:hypothetical protein EIP91_001069 [Steccherinum ochraceum]
MQSEFSWMLVLASVAWFSINGLQGIWIYYYVLVCVDPNPRNGVNATHTRFLVFKIFMFIVGAVVSIANSLILWAYFSDNLSSTYTYRPVGKHHNRCCSIVWLLFRILIILPLGLFSAIMPFCGGWIMVPIAQKWAWSHRCDSYAMYAILDARSTRDSATVPNVAHFYQTGNPRPLFTYSVNNGGDPDFWTFQLREFDQPRTMIPGDLDSTLQHIQYNFINETVTGNCTVPVASGSSITNSTACVSGTFNPNDWLSFNLTSHVPLTDTTTPVPASTALLRTVDKQWSFTTDAPSLILDTMDMETGLPQKTVLRTAVTKPEIVQS